MLTNPHPHWSSGGVGVNFSLPNCFSGNVTKDQDLYRNLIFTNSYQSWRRHGVQLKKYFIYNELHEISRSAYRSNVHQPHPSCDGGQFP